MSSENLIKQLQEENASLRESLRELTASQPSPGSADILAAELKLTDKVEERLMKRFSLVGSILGVAILIASIGGFVSIDNVIRDAADKLVTEKTEAFTEEIKEAQKSLKEASNDTFKVQFQLSEAKKALASRKQEFDNQFIKSHSELKNQVLILDDTAKRVRDLEERLASFSRQLAQGPQTTTVSQAANVDSLIRDRKYQEALKLDPQNVIALMRLGEHQTANLNYKGAADTFERLSSIPNPSGVQYSAYPSFILSYARLGNHDEALRIIESLRDQVQEQRGYLNSASPLKWLKEGLEKTERKLKDEEIKNRINGLVLQISERIKALLKSELSSLE